MADDGDTVLDLFAQDQALALGERFVELEGRAREGAELEPRHARARRPGFGLGDREQGVEGAEDGVGVRDRGRKRLAIACFVRCCAQHGLDAALEPRQRASQIVRQAVGDRAHAGHELLDLLEHLVQAGREMIEFVPASGKRHAPREIAAHDGAARLRDRLDAHEQPAAEIERTGHAEDDGDDQGHGKGLADDLSEGGALRHVASDEKPEAALEPERLRADLVLGRNAMLVALDLEAEPAVLEHGLGRPAVEVARKRGEIGPGQEIDAALLALAAAALGDHLLEPAQAARAVLLGEAADLRLDGVIGLGIDQAERAEVEKAEEDDDEHPEGCHVDEGAPEGRGAEEAAGSHVASTRRL